MMNELGRNTPVGFVANEPKAEDIFSRLNLLKDGFAALKGNTATTHLAEAAEPKDAPLKRSYGRFFNGTAQAADQKAILEDLLDQTLRRAHMPYQPSQTLEQYAAYGLTRGGQDAIVIYIMKMMQDGLDLPAPKAKAKGKK